MKYLAIALLLFSTSSFAYDFDGVKASLIVCIWEEYESRHGYMGEYYVDGKIKLAFFGRSYCSS